MRKFLLCILLALLMFFCASTHAGVVIGGTRFIYGEGRSSLDVSLQNDSDSAWLINSKVLSAERWPGAEVPDLSAAPFIVTPPLFKLPANQANKVRLIRTGVPLPADRESLFTLSVATIPAGTVGPNSVQMGVRSALKLIYRPKGLAGDPAQAYSQLRWSRTADGVKVENPTPFYVTLFMSEINGRPIDNAGVVAPRSTRAFNGCQHTAACPIRWQTLNDYGRVMPPLTSQVQ